MENSGHMHDETTRLLDVYTPLRTGYLAIGEERVETGIADMAGAIAEEGEEERFPTAQLCVLGMLFHHLPILSIVHHYQNPQLTTPQHSSASSNP
jgi:hypothetical protein